MCLTYNHNPNQGGGGGGEKIGQLSFFLHKLPPKKKEKNAAASVLGINQRKTFLKKRMV
jgi:hypothetical protein